jgi:shikimate 5-dehydrogenase
MMPESALESLADLEEFLRQQDFPPGVHLKLSPAVHHFSQLATLMEWQSVQPEQRSILPRSVEGRWSWVRLWLKGRQKINFLRWDQGSALDQPTLYEWLSTPVSPECFAGILGHPVSHSRTPAEHQFYFSKKQRPVFAIDIQEDEFQGAMGLLEKLGLQFAAVTSPHKKKAFQWADITSVASAELESSNTLMLKNGRWYAHNTDIDGFGSLFALITGDKQEVAVWGGGGTLPVILQICPQAICFSSRTAEPRAEYGDRGLGDEGRHQVMLRKGPRILIWAASPEASPPPEAWRPEFVIDLNYREDSLAREYALRVNAQYIDGLPMFKEQARAQQEFWDR